MPTVAITDVATAKKLAFEMQQLTARANLLQSLLFANATSGITQQTKRVTDAKAQIDKFVKEDAGWASIISGITSLLSAVDETVQVAKLAM